MKFSIICPTFNEEAYVEALIRVFLAHCPQPSELFFADAGSSDRTTSIVKEWSDAYPNIKLVSNERRYVSNAFNICYAQSSGKYLALIGAHTSYPNHFFKVAYEILEKDECDVVGGPLHQRGRSPLGQAIAYSMSTRFGVGGTEFRVSSKRMFVDSVAFAFYKRDIFEAIGLFDETLIRNQDDEMHYRMNAFGYRILMEPAMACTYHVRENLRGLLIQYYQYGLYKPMVLSKVKTGIRIRHLIPAAFVIYLLLVPILFNVLTYYSLFPLLLYLCVAIFFSISNKLGVSSKIWVPVVYLSLHISYGWGFLRGLVKLAGNSR